MESRPLSRWLLLAAIGVAVFAWAGTTRVESDPGTASVEIERVSGELQLTNSRADQAIFQASGLAPGGSVTGTVQLSNTGSLAGELGLAQLDVQDVPGANGGLLSNGVQLDVRDVTGGSSIPVFAGQLGGLGTRPLGGIGPGEARTYRFTASLPDTGVPPTATGGDNAFAGSGVTARYAWTATATGSDGSGSGGGSGAGPGGGAPSGQPRPFERPKFSLRVKSRQLLSRGWVDVIVQCDRSCTLDAWAKLQHVRRPRVAHRRAVVPLPEKNARLRLRLSKRARTMLRRTLHRRRGVTLRVYVSVVPVAGTARTYSRTVIVRRPKPRRR